MAAVDNPMILRQVALRALPDIIGTSDTHSLIAMAAQLSKGNVKHMLPQVVEQFSRNYRNTVRTPASQRKPDWELIENAFDDVDPEWKTCRRNLGDGSSEEILALQNLIGASPDLRQSMTASAVVSEDPDRQLLVLANVFPEQSVDDTLQQQFPQTDLGWHHRVVSNPVDPITIAAIASPAEQSRPTTLREWAYQQPGVIRAGFGDTEQVAAGGRVLYNGATDQNKPAPVSISGVMPPAAQQELRPQTLEEWAEQQPGTIVGGFGSSRKIGLNGVLIYDGTRDQGKMAPTTSQASRPRTAEEIAKSTPGAVSSGSAVKGQIYDSKGQLLYDGSTQYNGRDYGPQQIIEQVKPTSTPYYSGAISPKGGGAGAISFYEEMEQSRLRREIEILQSNGKRDNW
jgi:hypothetical protein